LQGGVKKMVKMLADTITRSSSSGVLLAGWREGHWGAHKAQHFANFDRAAS